MSMYLVARGAHGRPMLLHRLVDSYGSITTCGLDVSYWSRSYLAAPISAIFCKKCMKKEEKEEKEEKQFS